MRYDGYYILADLVEIPNLRQKASQILSRKLSAWCLGLEETPDPFLPQHNQVFFAIYSVAAAIYRWVVTLRIFWFLYEVLEPYGLKVISQMVAIGFDRRAWSFSRCGRWANSSMFPGRLEQVKRKNLQITLAMLAAVVLFVFAVPLPHRVFCSLEVKPRDAKIVYVEVPGRLEEVFVKPGQFVRQGTVLARLSNPDLELAVADLEGKLAENQAQLNSLSHVRATDEDAAAEIPRCAKWSRRSRMNWSQRRADLARLELIAPVDGTVLPPPDTPDQNGYARPAQELDGHRPSPRRTSAPRFAESTMFCEIGDPHQMEADLVIEQDDLEFVHEDQPVAIKLDAFPHRTFHSHDRRDRHDRPEGHAAALDHQGRRRSGDQNRRVGKGKTLQYVLPSAGPARRSRRLAADRAERPGQDLHHVADARLSALALPGADVQLPAVATRRWRAGDHAQIRRRASPACSVVIHRNGLPASSTRSSRCSLPGQNLLQDHPVAQLLVGSLTLICAGSLGLRLERVVVPQKRHLQPLLDRLGRLGQRRLVDLDVDELEQVGKQVAVGFVARPARRPGLVAGKRRLRPGRRVRFPSTRSGVRTSPAGRKITASAVPLEIPRRFSTTWRLASTSGDGRAIST